MRITKSLVLTAAWLAASGCMKTQSNQPSQPPIAATSPSATGTESAQAQPEMQPSEETSQSPTAESSAGMQQPPAAKLSAHDVVSAALACAATPSMTNSWSATGATGGGPPTSVDQNCATVASAANVSPQALRSGDKSAMSNVRKLIEQQAKSENISSSMHDQLLSFFDKGMSAVEEKSAADSVAFRYMGNAGATMSGGSATQGSTSTTGKRSGTASSGPANISSSDADKLSTHDRLRDLVQFAHGSNAGPVASEAEGLAWLLASERFMQTSQLPPRLKVLTAEPLFDTLLGVPTPAAAKGDPNKIPNNLWSQYLGSASRAARESGAGGAAGIGGGASNTSSSSSGSMSGSSGSASGSTRPHNGNAATKDVNNWREVVSVVQQRIESVAQQVPPSDLRQTLTTYAQQLRTEAVGGGPAGRSPSSPHHNPTSRPPSGGGMNHHGTPSGTGSGRPGSGSSSPGGSMSPSGGSTAPSGGGQNAPNGSTPGTGY